MEFNYIVNPESGKNVSIYSKTGKKVLRNYVKYLEKLGGKRNKSRRNKKKPKKEDIKDNLKKEEGKKVVLLRTLRQLSQMSQIMKFLKNLQV